MKTNPLRKRADEMADIALNSASAKKRLFDSEHPNPAPGSTEAKVPVVFDEVTLRASELRYRRLFEAAKDGILILDTDTGRIHDVNGQLRYHSLT